MSEKVFLILVDGMRIDAPGRVRQRLCRTVQNQGETACGAHGHAERDAALPYVAFSFGHAAAARYIDQYICTAGTYRRGLVERLKAAGKTSAFYYSWQLLRDLCRPGNLSFGLFYEMYTYPHVDRLLTEEAIARTERDGQDFVFLYLGEPDETGHAHGYMGPEYLASVSEAWDCIQKVCEKFGGEYQILGDGRPWAGTTVSMAKTSRRI